MARVARKPGPSVRLKLTLSYASFLMVAGTLLLATVWVFLLRYVPDHARFGPGPASPTRSDLLERAWDQNADPFTNAVRITVSALRKRLGEPWIIATVPGAGYRIDTEGGERG